MSAGTPQPMDASQERALLAPDRERINEVDHKIIALLGERFDIVRDVAALKLKHGIHPVLPDRIEEVVQRARAGAVKAGFDPDVAEKIYRILIAGAIDLETDVAKSGKSGSR